MCNPHRTRGKSVTAGMLGEFALALEKLGWDTNDELSVEIGGVAVTELQLIQTQMLSGQNHTEA